MYIYVDFPLLTKRLHELEEKLKEIVTEANIQSAAVDDLLDKYDTAVRSQTLLLILILL